MFRLLHDLWKRHVALPTPQDLGRPWTGGLPSREFSENAGYTWEDWDEEVREKYPTRWKVKQALLELEILGESIGRAGYWLRCHTITRYHLLDLSKAEAGIPGGYRWGVLSSPDIMLLSSFLALRIYVEQEKPEDPGPVPDGAEEHERLRKEAYDEAMFLYRWWTVDRAKEEAEVTRLFDHAHSLPPRSPERDAATRVALDASHAMEARPHEMLVRLVRIQETLRA